MKVSEKKVLLLDLARDINVEVDRWDNIKWMLDSGKQIRLNFKKNVVRTEWKSATGGDWYRISSVSISKIDIEKFKLECSKIYDAQHAFSY
ncbi:MAG: hypothetical protein DRQ78_12725 [Epsilonproteobacteria bacterium]|nr:MAG: hypothetical protein DRQ78_12725 [Campylobacterota bacterium]